jgi:hypothetical protein
LVSAGHHGLQTCAQQACKWGAMGAGRPPEELCCHQ